MRMKIKMSVGNEEDRDDNVQDGDDNEEEDVEDPVDVVDDGRVARRI